jgi:carbamoyl-phosphate synthase large subunit
VNIVINTPTKGNNLESNGFKLRRKAAEYKTPVFTCIDTAKVFLTAIKVKKNNISVCCNTINEYLN